MASVSAHRNDSLATNLETRPLSPATNGQSQSRRTTTPRPSISPLSSASKTHRSPVTTRDAIAIGTSPIRGGSRNGILQVESDSIAHLDDRSSSLSEPDDDPDEDELHGDAKQFGLSASTHFVQKSLEIDSEAETERLEATPQKAHKRNGNTGKTPTRLGQTTIIRDMFSDPVSPSVSNADNDSASISESVAGHKRKRSESVESPLSSAASDVGESPRKRIHGSSEDLDHDADPDTSGANGFADDASKEEEIDDDIDDLATDGAVPASSRKPLNSRKGRYKTRKARDSREESIPMPTEDGIEEDEEVENENSTKTEEEKQHKSEAMELFEDLARQFTSFKEKLYAERLEGLQKELHLLSQPVCEHAEYLRQVSAIDARMEKQTREAHASYRYRLQCIRERTLAERSQMHSQFFQEVRELRERTMNRLGEDWYNVQKERRQSHQETDSAYVYRFPNQKSVRIRQQARYNHEVSILSGFAKYVGFPAAPDLRGAQGDMLESDLKAMKISRRVAQPSSHPRPVLFNRDAASAIAQSERLAHEQYLEQNAWARPQAPIQQHGTPNLTHTPDWADLPGQARNAARSLESQNQHPTESFSTPGGQRTIHPETPNSEVLPVNPEGAAPTSIAQSATLASNRSLQFHRGTTDQGSPIHVAKQRHITADVPNFRNFSNVSRVSGASTIDAPSESERDLQDLTPPASKRKPMADPPFDVMQGQNSSTIIKDSLVGVGARGKEGAFGTPAPLASFSK